MAILELSSELSEITPLLMTTERPATDDRCWVFGFPALAAQDGKRIVGEVRDPSGSSAGNPTIEIYSDDAGAGRGEALSGFSGSPLVVGGVVVGHLRSVMRDDGVAALGQIAACPADRVLALLPESLRQDIAQRLDAYLSAELPFATPIANFIATYLGSAQQPEPFGGRSEDLRSLQSWYDSSSEPPYLLLAAPAGRGKSALLVRWIELLRQTLESSATTETHIVFVPISVAFGTNGSQTAMEALAIRLCAAQRAAALGSGASVDSWRDLVSKMLRTEPPAGTRIIVVLDGIDEAMGWEVGPGLFPAAPPKGIRVVLSAREMAYRSGQQWLQHLGWTNSSRSCLKTLSSLDSTGIREVVRSVKAPDAAGEAEDDVVEQLTRLSQGDPLVLNLYVKHLASGGEGGLAIRVKDLPSMAPGLNGYFERWWSDQAKLSGGSPLAGAATRHIFNLLALAVAPLERRELLGLLRKFQPDIDGDTFDSALVPLARFVSRDLPEDTYAFSHPRFAMHRRARLKRDGDDLAYASRFLEWGNAVLQAAAKGERLASSRYIVRHFLEHLQGSGAGPAEHLALLDPTWRVAWDLTFPQNFGGHDAVVEAVWRVLADSDRKAVSAGELAEYTGQQVRCALRLAAHATASRSIPEDMAAALLNFGIWGARTVLDYVRSHEKPWAKAEVLTGALPYLDGQNLIEAEAAVLELPDDVLDVAAGALASLCARHFQLGNRAHSANLARTAPHRFARALAAMSIARLECAEGRHQWLLEAFGNLTELSWFEFDELMTQFQHAFSTVDQGTEGQAATIEDRTRLGLLSEVFKVVEKAFRGTDPSSLSKDAKCQALKWVLPLLDGPARKSYLSAFFGALREGKLKLLATHTFWEIGKFVSEELAAEAMDAADCLKTKSDSAGALLAMWDALNPAMRLAHSKYIVSAAAAAVKISTIDDRRDFFRLMGRHGFGDEALRLISIQPDDDWYTYVLVEGIAQFLTREQTFAALAICERIRPEVSERARRHLLGQLASFDKRSAIEALRLATHVDLGTEVSIASTMLRLSEEAHRARGPNSSLDELAEISNPDVRLGAYKIAAAQISSQPGSRVVAAIDTFGTDFLALEALRVLAGVLDDKDLFSPPVRDLVSLLAYSAPSTTKTEQLVPFFRKAIQAGEGFPALQLASDLGNGRFAPPILAIAFAIADEKALDLVHRAVPLLDSLDDEWERPIATAALDRASGSDVPSEKWRQYIDKLSELDLLACSREVCQYLRQLPAKAQVMAFDEITSRFEFLPVGHSKVEALENLCSCATKPWLEALANNLKEVESSTSKNQLRSAIAIRFAQIGAFEESLNTCKFIGIRALKAQALSAIVSLLPESMLKAAWSQLDRGCMGEQLQVWASLLKRAPQLSREVVHSLLEMSFAGIVRSTTREVVVELWGAAGAIGWTGGERALADVSLALHEAQAMA